MDSTAQIFRGNMVDDYRHMTMVKQKKIEIPAGEFKAKCLQFMDDVQRDNIQITITKRGKPVARLVPIEEVKRTTRFGCMAGK